MRKRRHVDISAAQKRDICQLIPLNRPLCWIFILFFFVVIIVENKEIHHEIINIMLVPMYVPYYNFLLHTTECLYDLKMCDTDYRYVTDSIFRHSRLSDILSCDKPCRINWFWLYMQIPSFFLLWLIYMLYYCLVILYAPPHTHTHAHTSVRMPNRVYFTRR